MINPFTGIPSTNKSLSSEDKLQLLDDDKWIFDLASKLNIPAAGGNSGGGGGGGAVDSVNGQTGTVVLDSDDISEGTTNLYSQWQQDTVSSRQYISPKTESNVLYIGDRDAASALESSFNAATAMFPGNSVGGTNYFINPAYGTSFVAFGGLFAAGRARGTHASPTDVQDGDWLGGLAAVAYLNSGWVAGSTFALPGMYISQLDHSGSDFGVRMYLGSALFEALTVDMPITGTPQRVVHINRPQNDVDFSVGWDNGVAILVEGSSGNISFGDGAIGFFSATPVTQRTGDIKTGLVNLGLFATTSFVSEHRYLINNAI